MSVFDDGAGPPEDHADLEARLRRALHDRAGHTHPDPDALGHIEEALMSDTTPDPSGETTPRLSSAQRWILGGVAAVAAILVVVALVAGNLVSDGDVDVATDTSTTTATTTSTTTTEPSTTTSFVSTVDEYAVAFPPPSGSRRFDEPVAAARAYATDILGFTRLEVAGTTVVGDEAAVTVSDREDGPRTEIDLELLEDGSWFVLESTTPDVEVLEPARRASLATPFATSGSALAFEGTVDVLVLAQQGTATLGSGFVTGSGTPPPGAFDGRIFFSPPPRPVPGILVYRTLSPEDGHVEKATSFPVRLTDEEVSTAPERCGDTASEDDGEGEAGTRIVKVYFHCDTDLDQIVAVRRLIPEDEPAMLAATLDTLVAGPTESEREAGFTSVFPVPGTVVNGVVIDGGVAEVDFSGDLLQLANSSTNILVLREQLLRTATQFASVAAVEVTVGGSCEAFAEWSQSDSCLITPEEFPDPDSE